MATKRPAKKAAPSVQSLEARIRELELERDAARRALDEAIARNVELRGHIADLSGGAWLAKARAELWSAIEHLDAATAYAAARAKRAKAKA